MSNLDNDTKVEESPKLYPNYFDKRESTVVNDIVSAWNKELKT